MKKIAAILLGIFLVTGAAGNMAWAMEQEVPTETSYFPTEITSSQTDGIERLEKTYHLTADDDPAKIPTEPVTYQGKEYVFVELLKNDQRKSDSKIHTEIVTLNSTTNQLEKILKTLEPTLEIQTEDGYAGTVTLNPKSIEVEAAGYKTNSYTVSATRIYPNLSDADTSLIPKSITENGRTLTLAEVCWQPAATDYVDGYDLAMRYTAVAAYSGTASSKSATGYVVTAEYVGEVAKTTCEDILYTAVFASTEKAFLSDMPKGVSVFFCILVILIGILLLGVAGKQYEHYLNKKRGYEE